MNDAVKKIALKAIDASKPTGVYFGTVTSVQPLRINVEQRLTLESAQLILSRNVTDYKIDMTVDHWTENETAHIHNYFDSDTGQGASGSTNRNTSPTSHRHAYTGRKTFTVHNGLVNGDKVILLRVQGGQKYVVLDRVGT
jgi:hypothetical protein